MKCVNSKTLVLAILCHLFFFATNAQIYTQVTTAGEKGIKIVDPDGVKWWKLWDNPKTNVLLDSENPVPGNCPRSYEKIPLTTLKQNLWLEYQDCAEVPNKASAQLRFFSDPARVDKWQPMPPRPIPAPKKEISTIYWIIGGLLVLIILFFVARKKR